MTKITSVEHVICTTAGHTNFKFTFDPNKPIQQSTYLPFVTLYGAYWLLVLHCFEQDKNSLQIMRYFSSYTDSVEESIQENLVVTD